MEIAIARHPNTFMHIDRLVLILIWRSSLYSASQHESTITYVDVLVADAMASNVDAPLTVQ
jgi:hypothetical protein